MDTAKRNLGMVQSSRVTGRMERGMGRENRFGATDLFTPVPGRQMRLADMANFTRPMGMFIWETGGQAGPKAKAASSGMMGPHMRAAGERISSMEGGSNPMPMAMCTTAISRTEERRGTVSTHGRMAVLMRGNGETIRWMAGAR